MAGLRTGHQESRLRSAGNGMQFIRDRPRAAVPTINSPADHIPLQQATRWPGRGEGAPPCPGRPFPPELPHSGTEPTALCQSGQTLGNRRSTPCKEDARGPVNKTHRCIATKRCRAQTHAKHTVQLRAISLITPRHIQAKLMQTKINLHSMLIDFACPAGHQVT